MLNRSATLQPWRKQTIYVSKPCGVSCISDRSNFYQHMKRHSGRKIHMCDYCGKSFVSTSDLNKHVRVHTGEHPFKCDVCGKTFSDGSAWKRHSKLHSEKFRFQCSFCERSYTRRDLCNQHIKKTHSSLPVGYVTSNKITQAEARDVAKVSKVSKIYSDVTHGSDLSRFDKPLGRTAPPKKSWQTLPQFAEMASWSLPGDSLGDYQGPSQTNSVLANSSIQGRFTTGSHDRQIVYKTAHDS